MRIPILSRQFGASGLPTVTGRVAQAIADAERDLAEAAELAGQPQRDIATVDADADVQPVATNVTDNGGPLHSFRFEAFIATHPKLRHVRTRVRTRVRMGHGNAASAR